MLFAIIYMIAPSLPSYTAQLLLLAKKINNLFRLPLFYWLTHHYGSTVANAAVRV